MTPSMSRKYSNQLSYAPPLNYRKDYDFLTAGLRGVKYYPLGNTNEFQEELKQWMTDRR